MADLYGVICWYGGDIVAELKRGALLFDKLLFRHTQVASA